MDPSACPAMAWHLPALQLSSHSVVPLRRYVLDAGLQIAVAHIVDDEVVHMLVGPVDIPPGFEGGRVETDARSWCTRWRQPTNFLGNWLTCIHGYNLAHFIVGSLEACAEQCMTDPACVSFAFADHEEVSKRFRQGSAATPYNCLLAEDCSPGMPMLPDEMWRTFFLRSAGRSGVVELLSQTRGCAPLTWDPDQFRINTSTYSHTYSQVGEACRSEFLLQAHTVHTLGECAVACLTVNSCAGFTFVEPGLLPAGSPNCFGTSLVECFPEAGQYSGFPRGKSFANGDSRSGMAGCWELDWAGYTRAACCNTSSFGTSGWSNCWSDHMGFGVCCRASGSADSSEDLLAVATRLGYTAAVGGAPKHRKRIQLLRFPKAASTRFSVIAKRLAGCEYPAGPCCGHSSVDPSPLRDRCPGEGLQCRKLIGCSGHTAPPPRDRNSTIVMGMLRHPVERGISAFLYPSAHPECKYEDDNVSAMEGCFAQFLRSPVYGHPYSSLLTQHAGGKERQDLRAALRALQRMDFVGIAELFDLSVLLLFAHLPELRPLDPADLRTGERPGMRLTPPAHRREDLRQHLRSRFAAEMAEVLRDELAIWTEGIRIFCGGLRTLGLRGLPAVEAALAAPSVPAEVRAGCAAPEEPAGIAGVSSGGAGGR